MTLSNSIAENGLRHAGGPVLPLPLHKCTNFFHNIEKKKEIDAPNFLHLLADGQLLIYVADYVSTAIIYLWAHQAEYFLETYALGSVSITI